MPFDRKLLEEKLRAVFTELSVPPDQAKAGIKAATDIICGPEEVEKSDTPGLQSRQVVPLTWDKTLVRRLRRYRELLEKIELPPDGFTSPEQANAAA